MRASQCVVVRSSWIAMAILMCDNTLSVLFKDGFCCNYPRTTAAHFQAMLAAPSKGRWLRHNLYKILPYRPIALPCPAAGCNATACCPGVTLPNTLHATVTGGGSANGSYAITYDAAVTLAPTWKLDADLGTCRFATLGWTLQFQCATPPTSAWRLTTADHTTTYSAAGVTCSPLSVVFTGVDLTPCGGLANATITVTV